MYNKLFVPLQHSTEVVYFQIIIWYTFALSFTTIQLGEYAVRVYDTELYEYTDGKDLTFSVVISYATGDSERSNTVTCNPHNIATDIQTVVANGATENADVQTVSGICVRKNVKTADAVNGLAKGIYVIKSGKATQKVTVK